MQFACPAGWWCRHPPCPLRAQQAAVACCCKSIHRLLSARRPALCALRRHLCLHCGQHARLAALHPAHRHRLHGAYCNGPARSTALLAACTDMQLRECSRRRTRCRSAPAAALRPQHALPSWLPSYGPRHGTCACTPPYVHALPRPARALGPQMCVYWIAHLRYEVEAVFYFILNLFAVSQHAMLLGPLVLLPVTHP